MWKRKAANSCEGGNHAVYVNRREKKVTTVPRHREIDENLCKRICKDLGMAMPRPVIPAQPRHAAEFQRWVLR